MEGTRAARGCLHVTKRDVCCSHGRLCEASCGTCCLHAVAVALEGSSGAGGRRGAAGLISGVNRRHRGIVILAISAFQRCLYEEKALHSQHQRRFVGGRKEMDF